MLKFSFSRSEKILTNEGDDMFSGVRRSRLNSKESTRWAEERVDSKREGVRPFWAWVVALIAVFFGDRVRTVCHRKFRPSGDYQPAHQGGRRD